jgi:hypothetical protein
MVLGENVDPKVAPGISQHAVSVRGITLGVVVIPAEHVVLRPEVQRHESS